MPVRGIVIRFKDATITSSIAPEGNSVATIVHQPSFLAAIHEQCSRFPHYQLDFNSAVADFIQENGAVRGVVVRRDGVEQKVAARWTVRPRPDPNRSGRAKSRPYPRLRSGSERRGS
jgi:2-polyprenyl-6-methoxyphenol hydroxylase-like FAD-dependent oxidoreductase